MIQFMDNAHRTGKIMKWIAWLLGFALLVYGFQIWLEARRNPNTEIPTRVEAGLKLIELQRNPNNHYVLTGSINNESVTFFLDTGATRVAVPATLAEKLKLKRGPTAQVETASGYSTVYLTRIEKLTLGHIELYNVGAVISNDMPSNDVLLGMSALKDLEFTQQGDKLTIKQYPQQ